MSNKNMNTKLSVNFTKASTKQNIISGENISTSFGKISKYLDDLGTAAFTDSSDYATPTDLNSKVDKVTGKELMPSDLLDANGDVALSHLPDIVLGQMIYGGTVNASNVATLSTNAKTKLGTTNNTITLTNNTASITGYAANEGIYYIATGNATLANLGIKTGDWLLSTGSAWAKIDNTDEVSSVNNKTGAVTLNATDVNAVSTGANQGLSDTEKSNARTNIGAGTSSFDGNYNSLSNKPTIPAAVAVKGNAETSYRTGNVNLTPANIGLGNVGNFKAVSTAASQGLSDTEKSNARTNIGAGNQVALTGSVTGSATFVDGNTAAITTNLKSCNVGNNTGTAHPGWYKVAESNVFTRNTDKTLLLYAERGINDNNALKSGMLEIHVRTAPNINNAPGTMRAQWSNSTFTIPKNSIALTYSKTNHIATLWIYLDAGFDTWRFTVLSESSGYDRANNSTIWTLYDTRYADAQSSLPDSSDNTIVYSIPGQLDNLGYYGLAGRTTNTRDNPWALVAETTGLNNNNTGITLLFDYTFTEANNATSTGSGILSVNIRTDTSGNIITDRSYAKWITKMNELNNDDVVVTYNNSTKALQIWAKSDYPFKAMRVRPLSGGLVSNFNVLTWTFTTALNTNLYESYPTGDGITVLTPTCDIQEQIDYNTNNGVKNLFKITAESQTINGVTFTVDKAAGTITANGTATALIVFFLEERSKYLIRGNYKISSGSNNNNYWFGIYLDSTEQWLARIENAEFTIPEQYTFTQCALRIASGQTMNNVVFKPMIRDASIEDNTFKPYTKSNAELTRYTDYAEINRDEDNLTDTISIGATKQLDIVSHIPPSLGNEIILKGPTTTDTSGVEIGAFTTGAQISLSPNGGTQGITLLVDVNSSTEPYIRLRRGLTDYIAINPTSNEMIFATDSNKTQKITIDTTGIKFNDISMPYANNAGFHNSIYRGKNLGTSYTAAQKAQVQASTFDDLFVGDYWLINNIHWRIAHCNYYLNTGDIATTAPHLVIVPDEALATSYMNATNITTGAYVGSYMYTTTLLQDGTEASDSVFGKIKAAFGEENLLSINQRFTNAVNSDGNVSGVSWYNTRCFLMNQTMVYGQKAWSNGSSDGAEVGIDKTQLSLFAHSPLAINRRYDYWLRDVCLSTQFALISNVGHANRTKASFVLGVRPAFLLS